MKKVGSRGRCEQWREQHRLSDSRSDSREAWEQAREQVGIDNKRSELGNGLTRRQRTFVLEKLVGLNDKNAALAAGYSLSVAENIKQRIWNRRVQEEFDRLTSEARIAHAPQVGGHDEDRCLCCLDA
jgi:hypothetical protein